MISLAGKKTRFQRWRQSIYNQNINDNDEENIEHANLILITRKFANSHVFIFKM